MGKQKSTGTGGKASAPEPKFGDLAADCEGGQDTLSTTDQGLMINGNRNPLKAGERGAAAHGFFQVYESMERYTKAGFLADPSVKTPVFVRFSTVAGSRGSTDLARDVRGFAVKFYTAEGNYDLVGNNMPVFFIQDAIKFPDLVHAVKPEPHREIPQASSAHDTFWDFISLMPESTHMIMWLMSDRAIPRSYRMMEGFGVHTFRFINADGESHFVKFHWKPLLGLHSVVWDEAQKISGKDPDFHRRDLWDAIGNGDFPEWELGVQIVKEKDEFKFGFDLLDPTKLIPEELVPVKRIGKMTLNRNPDNFFAETEQVAFHPRHIVPGIDFSNDPLLQGRLFSNTDTQLKRLGSPNFHEFSRSDSFFDHFSQATLFYNSQSKPEKDHIVRAFRFELGKVEVPAVRERMVGILGFVDKDLAAKVAAGLGITLPVKLQAPLNHGIPADGEPGDFQPKPGKSQVKASSALSMADTIRGIRTRKVAILAADGFDEAEVSQLKKALAAEGAQAKIVAPRLGKLKGAKGTEIEIDFSLLTSASVLFDALYLPGGDATAAALGREPEALEFIRDVFKHCKAIGANHANADLLRSAEKSLEKLLEKPLEKPLEKDPKSSARVFSKHGVAIGSSAAIKDLVPEFILAMGDRHWIREADKPL